MKSKGMAVIFCAALVLLASSCQLAQENAGSIAQEDRMIGVFITEEYLDLFDFEGYMNDHLNSFSGGEIKINGDAEKYRTRLFATLTSKTLVNEETGERIETQDFVFEDMEGFSLFAALMPANSVSKDSYISSTSDEAVSDVHTAIAYHDDGKTTSLEGTIFVAQSKRNRSFYFNPVYQSADGSVYLMAGTGLTSTMDYEGQTISQSMDSTVKATENGIATTESLSVKVSVSVAPVVEQIVFLQMDADSKLLSRTVYAPGEMPEAITPESNAEYVVIETHKRGGENSPAREVYGKADETVEYFIAREDGICVKRMLRLEW